MKPFVNLKNDCCRLLKKMKHKLLSLVVFFLLITAGASLLPGCTSRPAEIPELLYDQSIVPAQTSTRPIKIGVLLPLTGPEAGLGEKFRNAMELALEMENGKVRERPVRLVFEDEGYQDILITLEKAKKLIVSDKVDLILGPFRDDANLSVTQLIASLPLVNVKWSPTGYSHLAMRYKYVFWTSQLNQSSLYPLGVYAFDLDIRAVTTLSADDADALDSIQGFVDGFRFSGGKITPQQVAPLDETDYFPYLSNMRAASAVVCSLPEDPAKLAFFKQYAQEGFWGHKSVFIAQVGGLSPAIMQEIGDNIIGAAVVEKYLPELKNAENQKFLEAYRKKFQTDPDNYACEAYNGMRVVLEALRIAGGNTYPDVLGPILHTRELELPTGYFRFAQNRTGIQPLRICLVVKFDGRYQLDVQKEVPPTEFYWQYYP